MNVLLALLGFVSRLWLGFRRPAQERLGRAEKEAELARQAARKAASAQEATAGMAGVVASSTAARSKKEEVREGDDLFGG